MGRKGQQQRHSSYPGEAIRNLVLKVKHSLPNNIDHLQELRIKQHKSRNGLPEVITRYDFHLLETLIVQHSS